jgi:hypothetical protein
MTPADIQKVVDNLEAQADSLMAKGERQYACGLLHAVQALKQLLPQPVAAPPTPPPAPEPEPPATEPEPEKKILGVF